MPYSDPEKQKEYQRRWMQKRRDEWFAANGPCVECGSWNDLELDHLDTTTKISHRVWSWSKDRQVAELAKCVAKCKPCHNLKSVGERAKGEANGISFFTESEVLEIRQRAANGETYRALASEYNCTFSAIGLIVLRKRWKHI